ncbi:MAG: hypothetical protein ABI822_18185, partial [Bryobacteraceae bacterium]
GAISHLENAISLLESAGADPREVASMSTPTEVVAPSPLPPLSIIRGGSRSYIDDSELILQRAGHPMHARDLAEALSSLRGKEIPRTSMESTVIRHIADLKDRARLAKMGPSIYGLPEWAQRDLAEKAKSASEPQEQHMTA